MTVDRTRESAKSSWQELPAVVRTYLVAHRVSDVATALETFATNAVVIDEGRTHAGRDEIAAWLDKAGSEYSYTTEFSRAVTIGAAYTEVIQHLEGNFPGGVADLHFRFTLDGEFISRLVIEP